MVAETALVEEVALLKYGTDSPLFYPCFCVAGSISELNSGVHGNTEDNAQGTLQSVGYI